MATQVTLRNNKGSILTHTELDNNFSSFMTLSGAGASRDLVGLLVPTATSDPTGSSGMIYYNSASGSLMIHNGSSWASVATDSVTKTIALLGI